MDTAWDTPINRKRYNGKYYINKHTEIKLQHKDYYSTNKERVLQKCKEYRDANKDTIGEKINCICGGRYTRCHKSTHFKSLLHKNYIINKIDTT